MQSGSPIMKDMGGSSKGLYLAALAPCRAHMAARTGAGSGGKEHDWLEHVWKKFWVHGLWAKSKGIIASRIKVVPGY